MASAAFANAPTTSRAGHCLFLSWDSNVRVVQGCRRTTLMQSERKSTTVSGAKTPQ
jgi:hypothetical protein